MKKLIFILLLFTFFSCSKEIDNTKRETSNNTDTQKTILAMWDSLTAWYRLDIWDSYPFLLEQTLQKSWYNYKVINAWISWNTSSDLLSRAWMYVDLKPDVVIIVIWWNDGLRWLSVLDMKQNILSIIDIFPNSKIVLSWMDLPQNLWNTYIKEFKKVYSDIKNERPSIYFLEFFLQDVAWKIEYNLDDMIHPNKKWYEIVSKNMFNFLEQNKIIIKN